MSRVSLVEQYNNKDVIAQIYDVKDRLDNALDDMDAATQAANQAAQTASQAATAANQATQAVNQLSTRTTVLEGYTGAPSDTASATGSLYARTKKNANDIADNTDAIADVTSAVTSVTAQSNADHAVVTALPTTYQLRSEKDSLNGYAGLSSAGKLATSQIDTGVNLNQILQAGAQLNTGEVLYVGTGGTIRSRVIGEGVRYVGNFASVAALNAFPNPQDGDFATVYGDPTQSNDGFWMYDGTQWNFALLFDVQDYELIANKVTGISSASTNSQYPSAKAVYDFEQAGEVANIVMGQTTASNGVTLTTTAENLNGSQLASGSVVIPTTSALTADSNVPVTSGGVKTAIDNVTSSVNTQIAGKQDTLTSTVITLAAASWSNGEQTVTGITPVTATNIVWIAPTSASQADYTACGVYATAQGAGSLTFTCDTAPTVDISVTVIGA